MLLLLVITNIEIAKFSVYFILMNMNIQILWILYFMNKYCNGGNTGISHLRMNR